MATLFTFTLAIDNTFENITATIPSGYTSVIWGDPQENTLTNSVDGVMVSNPDTPNSSNGVYPFENCTVTNVYNAAKMYPDATKFADGVIQLYIKSTNIEESETFEGIQYVLSTATVDAQIIDLINKWSTCPKLWNKLLIVATYRFMLNTLFNAGYYQDATTCFVKLQQELKSGCNCN